MKKIFIIVIPIIIFIICFIVYRVQINEKSVLTMEKLDKFSVSELEDFCSEYNHRCIIEYEYSSDIEPNKIISSDINNYKFIYSKGDYPIETFSISWGAAGDLIIYTSSKFKKGNTYNYDSIFKDIKYKIESYDIASYTQETLPAGCDSGYPLFCSPYEIVDAGINAGFDIVATATNHSLDQGSDGVERSVKYYDTKDIIQIGTFKQEDIESNPKIIEKNGINIGLLNYTDSLNGLVYKKGLEHTVKFYSKELMEKEANYLRENGTNFIIAFMHWGPEYNEDPSSNQTRMAKELANAGVDVTIGSHTHSVNPANYIQNNDESHEMLVAYSLGNLNAAQHAYKWNTAYGGILEFKLNLSVQNGKTIEKSITDVAFFPIFHDTYSNGLVIKPLLNSNYSNYFDKVCGIATKLIDIPCYNE